MASLHNAGRIFGPFLGALLLDVIGRKILLICCSFTFFVIWLIVLLTKDVWALYAVRTIFGVAVGLHDTISTLYIAEVSSPQIRGTFGSVAMAFFYAGELAAFAFATYLSYDNVAVVHASIAGVFLMFDILLREPPQSLLLRGRQKAAEKNFYWLHGPKTVETETQFELIKKNVREEKQKGSYRELFTAKANYLSLKIVLMLSILEMFTGFEAITSFASIAFASSELLTANEFTILFGFFQLVSVCLSSLVIDRFGRRSIMLVSFTASTIVHMCTTALFYVNDNLAPVPYFSWLIFCTITIYALIYSMGILTTYYTIRGELFPQSIKAVGSCIAVAANSIVGFVTTIIFLFLSTHYGTYTNFLLFSIFGVISVIYTYYEVPETKGKTLLEIQTYLEKSHKGHDSVSGTKMAA